MLQDSEAINVLLLELSFDDLCVVYCLVDGNKIRLEDVVEGIDAEGQTSELLSKPLEDVRRQHEHHQWVRHLEHEPVLLEEFALHIVLLKQLDEGESVLEVEFGLEPEEQPQVHFIEMGGFLGNLG